MSARLQSVLQDLKDSCGATVADLTPQELEDLVFACARVESPYSAIHAELIERPIFVSPGFYLWPITPGAFVWLTEFASVWWPDNSKMYAFAEVYALMNARNPDAFTSLTDRRAARAALIRNALRIACSWREIRRAVDLAFGIEPRSAPPRPSRQSPAAERAKIDFSALVARLEVASGIPAKSWLWGRSVASLMKSYAELRELSCAALGAKCECPNRELDDAIENLARICAAIGERLNNVKQQGN